MAVATLVTAVVWTVLAGLVRWLAAHPLVPALLAGAALSAGAAWLWRRREQVQARGLRYSLPQIDALHHRDFEHAVRDLMRRDGCPDAVQVGGAGDDGADVKATDPYGRLWVIQCKHRAAGWEGAAIGTPDLHVLNGTGRPSTAATSSSWSPTAASPTAPYGSPPPSACTWSTATSWPSGPPAPPRSGTSCASSPHRAGPHTAAEPPPGPTDFTGPSRRRPEMNRLRRNRWILTPIKEGLRKKDWNR
ncbi:restriction endonuclease [Streptomyces pyxinae]|uniref:restriction endonuclease n=1 Tax=Streptomyces pyxinae TaxID=2970734 RepID=UPI003D170D91